MPTLHDRSREQIVWLFVRMINKRIKADESDEKLVSVLKEVRAEAINLLEPTLPNWAKNPDSVRDIGVHEANRRMEMMFSNWNARANQPSKGPRT
jgi:hypothetical protein